MKNQHYRPFVKNSDIENIEVADDAIFVEGIATDTTRDVQGDVATEEFLKKVAYDLNQGLPVLLNHDGRKTIGEVLEAELRDDNKKVWVRAVIDTADPDVRKGILNNRIKFFSVGGWVTKAQDTSINGRPTKLCMDGKVVELSVTPVPINHTAMFRLTKSQEGEANTHYEAFVDNLIEFTIKKSLEEKISKEGIDGLKDEEKSFLTNFLSKGIIKTEEVSEELVVDKTEIKKGYQSKGPGGSYGGEKVDPGTSDEGAVKEETKEVEPAYEKATANTGKNTNPDIADFNPPPGAPDTVEIQRTNDRTFEENLPGAAKYPSDEEVLAMQRENSASNEDVIHADVPTITLLPDSARRQVRKADDEISKYEQEKADFIYMALHETAPHRLGKSYRTEDEDNFTYIHRLLHEMEGVPEGSPVYKSMFETLIYALNEQDFDEEKLSDFQKAVYDHVSGVTHQDMFIDALSYTEHAQKLEKAIEEAALELNSEKEDEKKDEQGEKITKGEVSNETAEEETEAGAEEAADTGEVLTEEEATQITKALFAEIIYQDLKEQAESRPMQKSVMSAPPDAEIPIRKGDTFENAIMDALLQR